MFIVLSTNGIRIVQREPDLQMNNKVFKGSTIYLSILIT